MLHEHVSAMYIPDEGCLVRTLTRSGSVASEALAFVPGVEIKTERDDAGSVIRRTLVPEHLCGDSDDV
jgi:hypothetical protein